MSELACFVRDSRDLALLPRSGEFFLSRAGGAGEDAQYFVFLHDDELFAINLDFRAGVFAEQDAVAFFDGQREGLAFVVGAALPVEMTSPSWGLSLAESGMMMPPRVVVDSSTRRTRMRS
jgi:hypothetical protein